AHRAHASTYGVPMLYKQEGKPVAAGFLMDEELKLWDPIVKGSGKAVAIVGGAKLKEKMEAVEKLAKKFDRIILGGVVANVFLRANGVDIGDSKYLEKDKDFTDKAKSILEKDAHHHIVLPKNAALATPAFEKKGETEVKSIGKGLIFADVLPTEEDLKAIREAERIVWFGPMGAYEFGFKEGSMAIVHAIAQSKGICVIGGGDLAAAAEGVKASVSTGGGASIQYITTGKLEALEALQ
ncbi:MAG: phosphoglycerate kinase, partial [Nanoarchaeota archaeon]|nr:phosphoglycerate kinase [Nanoarchaeota archaeon]